MDISDLRVALFSGNYNYVRDGANQALNRLSGYLLKNGAKVRIYSPKSKTPAFPSTGKLVGVPALPFPGRGEYRVPLGIPPRVQREQRMSYDSGIWSRGVETDIFSPAKRDLEWRRSLGISDDEQVICFIGRIVMEKGLDVFAEAMDVLHRRGVHAKVLVIGEGP